MNEQSKIKSNKSLARRLSIKDYYNDKVLNIPNKFSIENPLLSENQDYFEESEREGIIDNDKEDLTYMKMIIYSLPGFSKMAALVIFK